VHAVGGVVNPAVSTSKVQVDGHFATLSGGNPVFLVEFDVAVTVAESAEMGAEGKAGALQIFSAKVDGKSANRAESVSKLRFKVPMALGVDAATAEELAESKRKAREAFTRPRPSTPFVSNY
jgi:hypothetical protein